jgi:hypothetical protein
MDPMTAETGLITLNRIIGEQSKEIAGLKAENAKLRNDVEMLQRYHIAGRDMNDSVERFIENRDRLGDGHDVVKSRIEQMRNDLSKWKEAASYVQQHGRK